MKATIPPLSSYPTLPAQFYIHCRSFPMLLRTHECAPSHFSHVQLFVTPWTVAGQAPLSMGFSRQEHWGELPCPPPGGLPDLGTEPASLASPALAGRFFTASATWEASYAHTCTYQNAHNSCVLGMYICVTFHVHKSIPSLYSCIIFQIVVCGPLWIDIYVVTSFFCRCINCASINILASWEYLF